MIDASKWKPLFKPTRENLCFWLMFIIGLAHILMLRLIPTTPQYKAMLFLLYTLVCIFLVKKSRFLIVDIFFLVISLVPMLYLIINYQMLMMRANSPPLHEWILAIALLLAVVEATRRTTGLPLVVISIIFLIYGFVGPWMPGILWHRGFTLQRMTQNMIIVSTGVFSSPMQTASTIIVAFVIMGEMMLQCGAGELFTKASSNLTKKLTAGRAKMSVVAGLLFGMINGSAAANVVTTGQITIPLMKDEGYSSEYAGAITAAAATGGPLSPPVMGAAAFLLAEYCSITYAEVCKIAIMPAVFFYLGLFMCIHFKAKHLGIKAQVSVNNEPERPAAATDELETAKNEPAKKSPNILIEFFHLIIPLIVLIVLIAMVYPILYSCFICMIIMLVLAVANPHCKFTVASFIKTFSNGIKATLSVAAACACSGIIISVIGTTGLGITFTSFVLSRNISLLAALFFTMLILLLLGMGLPAVASYIVGSSVAVSVLASYGIATPTAHMFVYCFASLAVLTPPVALAAYAAAGISKANPVKTGWTAVAISIAGFIVPYVFVMAPAVILLSDPLSCILRIVLTTIGVCGLALGITGYFKNKMRIWTRALLIIGGLCSVYPTIFSDIAGVLLIAVGILVKIFMERDNGLKLA